jgi:hypothetical protein
MGALIIHTTNIGDRAGSWRCLTDRGSYCSVSAERKTFCPQLRNRAETLPFQPNKPFFEKFWGCGGFYKKPPQKSRRTKKRPPENFWIKNAKALAFCGFGVYNNRDKK